MQRYISSDYQKPGQRAETGLKQVFYLASEVDARIAELETLLRRVIEWVPAVPVEASLADEIGKALGL